MRTFRSALRGLFLLSCAAPVAAHADVSADRVMLQPTAATQAPGAVVATTQDGALLGLTVGVTERLQVSAHGMVPIDGVGAAGASMKVGLLGAGQVHVAAFAGLSSLMLSSEEEGSQSITYAHAGGVATLDVPDVLQLSAMVGMVTQLDHDDAGSRVGLAGASLALDLAAGFKALVEAGIGGERADELGLQGGAGVRYVFGRGSVDVGAIVLHAEDETAALPYASLSVRL